MADRAAASPTTGLSRCCSGPPPSPCRAPPSRSAPRGSFAGRRTSTLRARCPGAPNRPTRARPPPRRGRPARTGPRRPRRPPARTPADPPRRPAPASPPREGRSTGRPRATRRDPRIAVAPQHDRRHPVRQPERPKPACQLGSRQLAADDRVEHVAGQPALGVARDTAAQQLERHDRHRLVQRQAVEVRQRPSVLDRNQPRLGWPDMVPPSRADYRFAPAGARRRRRPAARGPGCRRTARARMLAPRAGEPARAPRSAGPRARRARAPAGRRAAGAALRASRTRRRPPRSESPAR